MSRRSIQRAHARRLRRGATAAAATAAAAAAIAAPERRGSDVPGQLGLSDSGPGSLRQAILDANGAASADTITFQSGLNGTVNVGAEMAISGDLTITGLARRAHPRRRRACARGGSSTATRCRSRG